MLLTYFIWAMRFFFTGGFNDVLECTPITVVWGLQLFPIGLLAALQIPGDTIRACGVPFSVAGYILYAGMMVAAYTTNSRKILIVLVILLLINVEGCHLDRTLEATVAP